MASGSGEVRHVPPGQFQASACLPAVPAILGQAGIDRATGGGSREGSEPRLVPIPVWQHPGLLRK